MKISLIIVAATVVALSMPLFSTPAYAPLVCQSRTLTVEGSWMRTMSGARINARRRWRGEARHRYGRCWDNWTRARNNRLDCRRRRRMEQCTASAIPCCRTGVLYD
jgi:hypothetical protein